jgi:hypothetical protein
MPGLKKARFNFRPFVPSFSRSKLKTRLGALLALVVLAAPAFGQGYVWKSVTIKGGGFVSGIVTHPNAPGLIYCRADIGGAYRWNPTNNSWIPLLDFATDDNYDGVESLTIDPSDTNRLYIASSRGSPATLLVSTNQGATFSTFTPPFSLNGNADGRSCGERMAVDPNLNSILFYGTRTSGLYRSGNYGATWTKVTSFPVSTTANSVGLAFVQFIPTSGAPSSPTPEIFVGVSQGGSNLFRSMDAGLTWTNVPTISTSNLVTGLQLAHHAALDGLGNMYLTFNNNQGPNNITNGVVLKLNLSTMTFTDVSPPKDPFAQGGYAGVCVDQQNPATLVVSTMDRWWAPAPTPAWDEIYRSTDGGATWTQSGPSSLPNSASAPWSIAQSPHWAGTVQIDPYDSNRAFFITGYGMIGTTSLTSGSVNWSFMSDGIEETVPLGITSPPSGPYLLSVHGDIGGFAHYNLDVSPPLTNYFATHRVTSDSIDFAESHPNVVVRTVREAPYGSYSLDGGTTWTDFGSSPPGASTSNSGEIAVSADGTRFVWYPSSGVAYYSINHGTSWTASTGGPTGSLTPIADRVNSSKFYVYSGGKVYVSTNGAATFAAGGSVSSGTVPRAVFGHEGDLWIPRGGSGLMRSTNSGASFASIAGVTQAAYVGFGRAAAGQNYPAVFISGTVGGVVGLYRSDDMGVTWVLINDPQHEYGLASIHDLCGDPRVYGRVYFGTEGRGIVYGSFASAPAAPMFLSATAGDGQVGLNWSPVLGTQSYNVKRSQVSGNSYTLVATNTSVVFTDTGLNDGTTYYYVVTATNSAGEGANSPEASALPLSSVAPQIGFSITGNQAQVSWPSDHTGWLLQMQTNPPGAGISANWVTIGGSGGSNQFFMPTNNADGSVFFRLVHP